MAHLNFELIGNNAFSSDQKGFKIVGGTHHEPYANSAEVLSMNETGKRHIGQEFKVWNSGSTDVDIWHFIGGTADGDLVKKASGGGGITSVVAGTNVTVDDSDPANPVVSATGNTNFANSDLTADGNRTHDFDGHKLNINGLSEFNLGGVSSLETVPFVEGGGGTPQFTPDFDGVNDGLLIAPSITDTTISVILNVDGTDTAPITFTRTDLGGIFAYIHAKQTGTTVTCVNYTANILQDVIITANIPPTDDGDSVSFISINEQNEFKRYNHNLVESVNSINPDESGNILLTIPDQKIFGSSDSTADSDRVFNANGNNFTILYLKNGILQANGFSKTYGLQLDATTADGKSSMYSRKDDNTEKSSFSVFSDSVPTSQRNGGDQKYISLSVNGNSADVNGNVMAVNPVNNFADDTAAASGGIAIGGLYHSSGIVKIRLS